jgi:chromosome segregation ATPase
MKSNKHEELLVFVSLKSDMGNNLINYYNTKINDLKKQAYDIAKKFKKLKGKEKEQLKAFTLLNEFRNVSFQIEYIEKEINNLKNLHKYID